MAYVQKVARRDGLAGAALIHKPGWLLAPYFQYVFRPSGGIPNPNDPSGISRIGDAAVFGLTTTLKY
jgi:hypothetical protein